MIQLDNLKLKFEREDLARNDLFKAHCNHLSKKTVLDKLNKLYQEYEIVPEETDLTTVTLHTLRSNLFEFVDTRGRNEKDLKIIDKKNCASFYLIIT